MKRKIIGVSGGIGEVNGFIRSGVSPSYFEAVTKAGGAPIMLPIIGDEDAIKDALSICDGLILSGGPDIDPIHYGQPIHRLCGEINEPRDDFEFKLMKAAKAQDIPILGICRGIQMINVYFGGTLFQDVSLKDKDVIQHSQKGSRGKGCQTITVEENSFFHQILDSTAYVNSYHHQSIDQVAPGFKVTAVAVDGIVEAIEHEDKKIYGVQFHPEMMHENDPKMLAIFKKFIEIIE